MVTALNQPADRMRGLDAGADDFLSKPIDEMALPRAAIASDDFAVETDGHSIAVTVSVGLAESAGDSSTALLRRADTALYRSKQDGRNRVSVDHARD
jgi:diguanylate cyclase (GGDEF)-like protein